MTYIFDLDGTLMPHHKTEWLPGAKYMVLRLLKNGHGVIFVTGRGPQDEGTDWSVSKTMQFLKDEGMNHVPIIYDMPPGRVIVDDRRPHAIWRERDKDWGMCQHPELPENMGEAKFSKKM